MSNRESLESSFHRHGAIETFSAMIEHGEKPPYDDAVALAERTIDPPIDRDVTEGSIREKKEAGQLNADDFDTIIYCPVK